MRTIISTVFAVQLLAFDYYALSVWINHGLPSVVFTPEGRQLVSFPYGIYDWVLLLLWAMSHALTAFLFEASWRTRKDIQGAAEPLVWRAIKADRSPRTLLAFGFVAVLIDLSLLDTWYQQSWPGPQDGECWLEIAPISMGAREGFLLLIWCNLHLWFLYACWNARRTNKRLRRQVLGKN